VCPYSLYLSFHHIPHLIICVSLFLLLYSSCVSLFLPLFLPKCGRRHWAPRDLSHQANSIRDQVSGGMFAAAFEQVAKRFEEALDSRNAERRTVIVT
jgi:hypothetical protein